MTEKATFTIREYKADDQSSVIGLLRLNTPEYFSSEEELDLIHYLQHEIDHYYVVESNGLIIGCGGINFAEDKTVGKISWDILHPDFQGQSIGSALLKYRIKELQQTYHIQKITVRTSQLVYRFYEKNGFVLTKIAKDYWAPGYDLYSMRYDPEALQKQL
ncbi:GNAT family N-acetyltransferase [Sphingobacterium spiritivorum]|uniref:GNAT family N-acetyltransferase n=1 Tax=Sphingobacterium TaxID=28453 RepID=UPI0025D21ED8|nr:MULTISPECIES: GNAT family N-acetyltransferase [unclassified Sphingobacterium]